MGWNWWVAAACVLAYVCLLYREEALALWARVRRAHHAVSQARSRAVSGPLPFTPSPSAFHTLVWLASVLAQA